MESHAGGSDDYLLSVKRHAIQAPVNRSFCKSVGRRIRTRRYFRVLNHLHSREWLVFSAKPFRTAARYGGISLAVSHETAVSRQRGTASWSRLSSSLGLKPAGSRGVHQRTKSQLEIVQDHASNLSTFASVARPSSRNTSGIPPP
jgi:hypothetical protein